MRTLLGRQSDGSLLAALRLAQAGDLDAQETLLAVLYVPVLDYVRSLTRRVPDDEDTADDVAQETLIRIAAHVRACRATTDDQVLGWALAIARTRFIDEMRSRKDRAERITEDTVGAVQTLAGAPDPAMMPLGTLLRRAVRALPRETRLLLELRVDQGGSWAEVGEALRTTAAGAKRRFQRAQARLRDELVGSADRLPLRERGAVRARLRKLK